MRSPPVGPAVNPFKNLFLTTCGLHRSHESYDQSYQAVRPRRSAIIATSP
jgi:hypothetical protein